MTEQSKSGARLVQDGDGNFRLVFEDTRKGRAMQRYCVAVGSKLRDTYVAKYDDNHNRQFHHDKKIDQYARIQSFKDQCLIENIIKRCVGGDMSGLQQMSGMYGDISGMPSDPRSMHDLMLRSKEVYEGFSEKERLEAFGGTFEGFLSTFADNHSLERFLQSRVKPNTQEVKKDGAE